MSARLDVLGRERELLVARSALSRLRLRHRTLALRDSLSWRSAAVAAAATPPARRLAFDLALTFVGVRRAARTVALAGRALMFARFVRALAGIAGGNAIPPRCATEEITPATARSPDGSTGSPS